MYPIYLKSLIGIYAYSLKSYSDNLVFLILKNIKKYFISSNFDIFTKAKTVDSL